MLQVHRLSAWIMVMLDATYLTVGVRSASRIMLKVYY